MDYLKTRAPFWKKEATPDGARWVEARASDDDAAARWNAAPGTRPARERDGARAALIGVDWGTTSARAYRLDAEGAVLDARAAPLGIQQVRDAFRAGARRAPRRLAARPGAAPRLRNDRQPPGLDRGALRRLSRRRSTRSRGASCARRTARSRSFPGFVVPRRRQDVPDVMRGEETQIVGRGRRAMRRRRSPILPGTHSKWAIVRDGTIAAFATYMTGEVYAVLREHSILGRMADRTARVDLQPSRARHSRAACSAALTRRGGAIHCCTGCSARARSRCAPTSRRRDGRLPFGPPDRQRNRGGPRMGAHGTDWRQLRAPGRQSRAVHSLRSGVA